jgi:hypothetical protein
MNKSYLWVGAACTVGLLAAAYFGLRSRGDQEHLPEPPTVAETRSEKALPEWPVAANDPIESQSQPPPEPLPQAKLQPAIVDTGDGMASARYREARHCFRALQDLDTAKANAADCKQREGIQVHEQGYASCLNENWPSRAQAAQQTLSGCGEVTKISRKYFEATRDAARAGDPDAQVCYLQSLFGSDQGTPLTAADNAEYKQLSSQFIDAGLRRGDWRVVHLMTGRSGPITQVQGIGQQATRYRMTKLLRLGASGSYATGLDYKLKLLANPDIQPSESLPGKVIKEADDWAQETYNAYFAGVPGTTGVVTICDR